jgi:hypothetical protein
MAARRRVTPAERALGLRKIATALRALADRVETEELKRREHPKPEGVVRAVRWNSIQRAASKLLLKTVSLGGPQDEGLRRIVLSWRGDPAAGSLCFVHVSRTWRALSGERQGPAPPGDLLICAAHLRVVANGVWSDAAANV